MVGNGISEPSTVISQQILPANSLVHPKINSSGIFQIRHQGGLWGHRQFNQQCFFRKCVFFQGGKEVVEINFGVKTLKIAGILTKPRSSCLCTSLHPSTKRPKSYLPPGGEHRESDGVLGCGRLFQTFKVWHRVFLQKLSPPLQNQHGLVQPEKNHWIEKGTSSEANLPDLGCFQPLKVPGCTEGTTSDIQHDPKGLLLLASKSS